MSEAGLPADLFQHTASSPPSQSTNTAHLRLLEHFGHIVSQHLHLAGLIGGVPLLQAGNHLLDHSDVDARCHLGHPHPWLLGSLWKPWAS